MVLTSLQYQILINGFNHLNINQPVQMADVNSVLSPFEGNTNPGDPTGFKLHLQATKDIYKETDNLDISVPNTKDIVYHFISLAKKIDWVRLALMVGTDTYSKNIFRVVEHIYLEDIQNQVHGYFGLLGIGNSVAPLTSPLKVSDLTHLSNGNQTQSVEIKIFFDRVRSDMIAKAIEVSITKKSVKKLRLHRGLYEWTYYGGLISNDGPTMLYLTLKIINPATRIDV